MKTFKGTASIEFKLVVPDTFVADLRADACGPDATPFQKQVQARHPTNDDEFLAAVLSNGIRVNMRNRLLDLLHESGLGGTVSPAKIEVMASAFQHDAPANAEVISYQRKPGMPAAVAAPYQGGFATAFGLIYLLLSLLTVSGWIMNIVHLIRHAEAGAFTMQVLLEALGVLVFPLGAILGWLA